MHMYVTRGFEGDSSNIYLTVREGGLCGLHHHREGSNPAACPRIKIVEGVGRFGGEGNDV